MFFLTFSWTKERIKPIKEEKTSLKDDVKDLATNKPWWILLVAGIMVIGFNSLRDGSAVYYFKYYVEASDTVSFTFMSASVTLITIYLVLGQAANILGIMLVPTFTRLMGKKYTFLTATVGATIFSILFYFLPKDGIYGILALQILISICGGMFLRCCGRCMPIYRITRNGRPGVGLRALSFHRRRCLRNWGGHWVAL